MLDPRRLPPPASSVVDTPPRTDSRFVSTARSRWNPWWEPILPLLSLPPNCAWWTPEWLHNETICHSTVLSVYAVPEYSVHNRGVLLIFAYDAGKSWRFWYILCQVILSGSDTGPTIRLCNCWRHQCYLWSSLLMHQEKAIIRL